MLHLVNEILIFRFAFNRIGKPIDPLGSAVFVD